MPTVVKSLKRLRAHRIPPAGRTDTEYNEPGTPVWQRTGFMHQQRSEFAARHVASKRVLNVACGPGYAEAILAKGNPASIVGVDYDRSLIERLQAMPARTGPAVRYEHANAEELPDTLGKFDVIVSFENIEHLRAPLGFLQGMRRLANPGATLLLSTPNRLHYSGHPVHPVQNPYHVHEYDFAELEALLAPFVSDVQLFGQFESPNMVVIDQIEAALQVIDSYWLVRLEKALRVFLGKPAPAFYHLPFETELRPTSRDAMDAANTFVLVAGIR